MKDHRKAKVINEITAIAKKYGHTQQLRSHIHDAVIAVIKEQEKDTKEACCNALKGSEFENACNDMRMITVKCAITKCTDAKE